MRTQLLKFCSVPSPIQVKSNPLLQQQQHLDKETTATICWLYWLEIYVTKFFFVQSKIWRIGMTGKRWWNIWILWLWAVLCIPKRSTWLIKIRSSCLSVAHIWWIQLAENCAHAMWSSRPWKMANWQGTLATFGFDSPHLRQELRVHARTPLYQTLSRRKASLFSLTILKHPISDVIMNLTLCTAASTACPFFKLQGVANYNATEIVFLFPIGVFPEQSICL